MVGTMSMQLLTCVLIEVEVEVEAFVCSRQCGLVIVVRVVGAAPGLIDKLLRVNAQFAVGVIEIS